jgi:RNA binding exosome subunit
VKPPLTKRGAFVSSKPPIGYVDVRVFAHATEEPEKVLVAVRNILPLKLGEEGIFRKTSLTGHHGNPIVVFEKRLTDKKELPLALKRIGERLNVLDKEALAGDLRRHLERHDLYLRFDKQAAFQGKVRFSRVDPVRFKVHFKSKNFGEIVEICQKAGLLL